MNMLLFGALGGFLSLCSLILAVKYRNSKGYWISLTQFAMFCFIVVTVSGRV
jgi:hypothetical protein